MRKIFLFLAFLLISFSCFSQSRYISETTKKIVKFFLLLRRKSERGQWQ
jgi:hypothetical protein